MTFTGDEDRHGGDVPLHDLGTSPSDRVDKDDRTAQDSTETVVKQLQDKLSQQGRENKELSALLREAQETNKRLQSLVEGVGRRQQVTDNGSEDGPDVTPYTTVLLSEEATPEDTQKALKGFAKVIADYTRDQTVAVMEDRLNKEGMYSRASRTAEAGEKFFREKGVPQLADKNSDFYSFVVDEIKRGNAVISALWSAVDQTPNEVYPYIWEKYLDSRGIKREQKSTVTTDEHRDAMLSDFPASGSTPSRDAIDAVRAAEEKAGRPLSFEETAQLMARKKLYAK